jgi:hypothetical protein
MVRKSYAYIKTSQQQLGVAAEEFPMDYWL